MATRQVYPISAGKYYACDDSYIEEFGPVREPLTRVAPNQFVLMTVLGSVTYTIEANAPNIVGGEFINCDYGSIGIFPERICAPKIASDPLTAKLARAMQWFTIHGNSATITHDDGIFTITDGANVLTLDTIKFGTRDHALWVKMTGGIRGQHLAKNVTLSMACFLELMNANKR